MVEIPDDELQCTKCGTLCIITKEVTGQELEKMHVAMQRWVKSMQNEPLSAFRVIEICCPQCHQTTLRMIGEL